MAFRNVAINRFQRFLCRYNIVYSNSVLKNTMETIAEMETTRILPVKFDISQNLNKIPQITRTAATPRRMVSCDTQEHVARATSTKSLECQRFRVRIHQDPYIIAANSEDTHRPA